MATKAGLKPQFFVRQRAQQPSFSSRAEWEIICELAQRMGLEPLAFGSIEEIWKYQLADTGVSMADFRTKGFVELADAPLYRPMQEVTLPTPSKKFEMVSAKWAKAGLDTLPPYQSPPNPPEGQFRIAFGRIGVHTQGHTVNNPLLAEQMSENVAWLHPTRAKQLGIADGDPVEVFTAQGQTGRTKAFVTECIHPEALFMVHGFGHRLDVETRACGRGAADQELMPNGLANWDQRGGGLCLQEHFVGIRKIEGVQP